MKNSATLHLWVPFKGTWPGMVVVEMTLLFNLPILESFLELYIPTEAVLAPKISVQVGHLF